MRGLSIKLSLSEFGQRPITPNLSPQAEGGSTPCASVPTRAAAARLVWRSHDNIHVLSSPSEVRDLLTMILDGGLTKLEFEQLGGVGRDLVFSNLLNANSFEIP